MDRYQISMWDSHTESTKQFGFSELIPVMRSQPGCPVIREGDNVANIFIDLSPLEMLRNPARRYAYEKVIRTNPDELEQLKERFSNKIVLVGVEHESDIHYVGLFRKKRYGLELHADALNTILNNVTIRSLRTVGQLIIMICLGLLGASMRYWTPQAWRYKRIGLFLAGLIAYLASTIYLYSQYYVLLNSMYHVMTFGFTYWVTGKIERKYFV
jgi:CHASE2 domain-containing sensor protein